MKMLILHLEMVLILFNQNDFWVLSVERARYKEKLFPGTFNLTLSGSGGLELFN
jgi:hypothetical protein